MTLLGNVFELLIHAAAATVETVRGCIIKNEIVVVVLVFVFCSLNEITSW